MNLSAAGDDSANETESFENLDSVRLLKDDKLTKNEINWSENCPEKEETKETDAKRKSKEEFNPGSVDQHREVSNSSPSPSSIGSYKDRLVGKYRKFGNPIFGHQRLESDEQTAFKDVKTVRVMGSVQLGIHYTIGRLASKPERDLLMNDFMLVESTTFAAEGSSRTPAHNYSQFIFKTYAPIAFRYFRELFRIPTEDYLLSFCKNPMNEIPNSGSSGSSFYVTSDDKFIMKTIQSRECDFLQKLLPGYYMNLHQNPETLLPKFFGLYCYKCEAKRIRLVAMNNVLPSHIRLHQKYDLKGSTYKRTANKKSLKENEAPTYKDLDFIDHYPDGIYLDAKIYHEVIKTIERDCRVLESFKIMDFSLLLGIRILDKDKTSDNERNENDSTVKNFRSVSSIETSPTDGIATKAHSTEGNRKSNEDKTMFRLHGGIPATAMKGDKLSIFIGIIDILQSYRLAKRIEHSWKSIVHNGDTVSVHNPAFYSQRFRKFMTDKVFKKLPATGKGKNRIRTHSKIKSLSLPQPATKNQTSNK